MPKPIGSNKANLERTRAHLLAIATQCFVAHGYHDASTNMVIKAANSSRGALYHHFPDKLTLFRAVYDDLVQQMAERIAAPPCEGKTATDDLIHGCIAYLQVFTDQTFARIMLIDAPNVLGNTYCQSRDAETAYKALHEGVTEIVADPKQALLLTDFLSGALDSYAMKIATADNRGQACEKYSTGFQHLASILLKTAATD